LHTGKPASTSPSPAMRHLRFQSSPGSSSAASRCQYALFFCGLLHYYQLDFWHLPPNSFTAVAFFIHLCEAFLGIAPHFDLFRYLYHCKIYLYEGKRSYVGGAGFQMRQGRSEDYFKLPFYSSLKGWQNEWFLIENHGASITKSTGHLAETKDSWSALPSRRDNNQIQELLGKIKVLKERGLTAMAVAIDFVHHNIQPLKDRVHPAFYYHGLDDPTRETTEDIPPDEVISHIRTFFAGPVTNIGAPRSFSIYNPPPEVSSLLLNAYLLFLVKKPCI